MDLTVGRIGRAHGVQGEVTVEVRTDSPDERFAPGSVLATDPPERGPVTVARARWHSGRLLLSLEGVEDREGAESLRNTMLVIDVADLPPLDDPDEFYDHQLVGLAVMSEDAETVGEVTNVIHAPGNQLLVVALTDEVEDSAVEGSSGSGQRGQRRDVFIPFVREIVPVVDLQRGHIVINPPPGLLEL